MRMPPFHIYFVLDGETYAARSWHAVPPVGDHVMFHPKDGPFTAEVTRVEWGVAPDDRDTCTVNVYVTRQKSRHRIKPADRSGE
jgi:hypothetical protein